MKKKPRMNTPGGPAIKNWPTTLVIQTKVFDNLQCDVIFGTRAGTETILEGKVDGIDENQQPFIVISSSNHKEKIFLPTTRGVWNAENAHKLWETLIGADFTIKEEWVYNPR